MANPQKENGFVPISRELLEALAKIRISGEARQVFDFIMLKTYGWGKKEDKISLSQISLGTGMSRVTCCKAINKLESMNIITKKGNSNINIYGILKNYEHWKPLPKKVTAVKLLPKKVMTVTKKGNSLLPKKVHTIDTITKDTITIDNNISDDTSHNIQLVFKTFYEEGNEGINFGNKTERKAAEWLLKKYGLDKTINTIKYAMSLNGKPYAPVISTPYQLKNNLVKLIAYYKREQQPKKGQAPNFKFI